MAEAINIKPQAGPQEAFLSSSADIVIYGGAAGGGKSWGLLLEPIRHVTKNKDFFTVVFRRNLADAKKPGATWDQMGNIYPLLGAKPNSSSLTYNFLNGGKVSIGHLEHENTKLDWQSSEVPLFCWDELTHFTRTQFFYLLSRNRSMCGVKPYIRATCNPDPDSWVKDFIAWWLNEDTGFPIPEHSGVIRWFISLNDVVIWADSREELVEKYQAPDCKEEDRIIPKSCTFISANIYDNKELLKKNPEYLANLKALGAVDQARLLGGNWKIRPAAGLYFRREWCPVVDAAPAEMEIVRYWDLAATEKTDNNDPDWTVGVKMGRDKRTGRLIVLHVSRFRETPARTEQNWKNTASQDGDGVRIGFPQDPGQAGKTQAAYIVKQLMGYTVQTRSERGDKVTRFGPFSSQAQAGNVDILRGAWNDDYFTSLEAFDGSGDMHDDDADATGGAFAMLVSETDGMIDFYEQEYRQAIYDALKIGNPGISEEALCKMVEDHIERQKLAA
jgi:predicted phage terminase large subunit-like protein